MNFSLELDEIYEYCKRRNIHLCVVGEEFDCPYREYFRDTAFCTISNFLADYYIEGKYKEEVKQYIELACNFVRQELLEHIKTSQESKIRKEKLLANASVGDKVFCIPKCDDVILLEKNVDFSGRCRCKTMEGKEFLVFADDLNLIYKGKNHITYKTNNVNEILEFRARKMGFRVEKYIEGGLIIYKLFGDSLKMLSDFIEDKENFII